MGGRGQSSASHKGGLPGGAVAFTFGDDHPMTLYQNGNLIMRSGSTGSTLYGTPVTTDLSLSQIYENVKKSGQRVQLHSSREVDLANAAVRKNKAENQFDIAHAELHPNAGRAGIHASRLLVSKRRAREAGR